MSSRPRVDLFQPVRSNRARAISGGALLAALLGATCPGASWAGPDVKHYDLNLQIDATGQALTGTARIDVTAVKGGGALSTIDLDLVGYTVTSVTWNGVAAGYGRVGSTLTVTLPAPLAEGGTGTIVVAYNGQPQAYPTDQGDLGVMTGKGIVFAINVTEGARYWFPGRDRLDDKASVDLALVLPKGNVSAGPGHLVAVTDVGGGNEKHQWSMSQEVTPYLISFAFSNRYVRQASTLNLATGPKAMDAVALADTWSSAGDVLAQVPDMVDFMQSRYGIFPYDKVAFHEIPFPGDVEQPGNISMGSLYWNSNALFSPYWAHELSHTWFQGQVTIRTWNDIFLSESIAAWHEILWTEESEDEAAADVLAQEYLAAYILNIPTEGSFPLSQPAVIFGYTVYLKGPLVWRLLEHLAGRDELAAVLQQYLKDADGVGDLNDFFTLLPSLNNPDLAAFRSEWVDRAGLPDYRFGWRVDPSGDGFGLSLRLTQSGAVYTTPIDVEIQLADGTTRTETLRPGSGDFVQKLCLEQSATGATLDPRYLVPRGQTGSPVSVDPGDDACTGGSGGCGAASLERLWPVQGAAAIPLLTLVGLVPMLLRRRRR